MPLGKTTTGGKSTPPLAVCYDGVNCGSFESITTPKVAVDPGEDTVTGTDDDVLVGVVTNVGHEMNHMPTARPDTSGRKAAETTHIPHEDPPWLYWMEGVQRVRDMPTR